jgi:5'-nucleotidase / UDP-sugar diphosphatase
VVALSSVAIPKTTMAGRFEGLDVAPYEEALATAVAALRAQHAEAIVVLADECPSEIAPILAKHADWKIAAVVGGHCARPYEAKSGETSLLHAGKHFESYARVKLSFDATKPEAARLTSASAELVDISKSTAAPDTELSTLMGAWSKKNDAILGEEIGFTKAGIKANSPEMTRWAAGAIRENLKVDVVLLNKSGIRQDLAPGKITKGSVYSVMPFENSVVTLKVKGSELVKALANPVALFDGVKSKGPNGPYADAAGKAIDPNKVYTVATLDYVYFGGDGFQLEKADADPGETGRVWQTPIIEWTKKQASTNAAALETKFAK